MRVVVFLVLAASPVFAEPPKAPPKPTDQEQLVGVWVLTSADSEMVQVSGEQLNRVKLALTGRTYLISTDQPVSGAYIVDATRRVKAIDMDTVDGPNKGKVTRCIYELDGNTLRICQGQAGTERPTEFSTKPGSGLVVLVFKRLTP
ncbi:hypothetical protein VT84_14815 [Gemmata sp. SH-PL17]|uniref:TIGR03067 domain-containing protein n=1 Tax=Gemmata sp. SH-PL17 TaxID=1630693 RepID=UPI0004B456DB|nr:TIGR03067 domain-containing protein [Gemmata sp. SH-PL17]AMV25667.1 hypothetical protein VT84_14815 [Gemmata sp. SH-PL17]